MSCKNCKLVERHLLTLNRLWRGIGQGQGQQGFCTSSTHKSSRSVRGPHPLVPDEDKRAAAKGDRPWKDAASLILAAPNTEDKNKTDFLVMKRSTGSSFAPNTLCFPGGVVSPADSDKQWMDFYRTTTSAEISGIDFFQNSATQPPIYSKKKGAEIKSIGDLRDQYRDKVPPHVALRIAAVRETFEECGILIVRRNVVEEASKKVGREGALGVGNTAGTFVLQDPEEVEKWQQRVGRDPGEFITMCKELFIRPDLNALVEWSNWLTPNSFVPRRYDTIFYMAILPHALPFLSDAFEVSTIRWTSAEKVLQGAQDGKAKVITPQIYELARLKDTSVERIQRLMRMRLKLGIERCCPCYIKVNDAIISVFPGDDLYPPDYRIEEYEEIRELDQTLEQIRSATKRHHRIEFKSEFEFQVVVNIGPRCGQVYIH